MGYEVVSEKKVSLRPVRVREWLSTKEDSRWRTTALEFIRYLEELHNSKLPSLTKRSCIAGCREALQMATHPHHSSSSQLHLLLDVVDEFLRELGYDIPESCEERWRWG